MRIGLLTSGGDAPGMNAAIRAVVKAALFYGWEPYGIEHGYAGLLAGEMGAMDLKSVEDIIHLGGTTLRTSRFEKFKEEEAQHRALSILKEKNIDALVVIGGEGSLHGAARLSALGARVIGIPASIDNDIPGTEYAIGFDSAVNTVAQAVDKLKDTMFSHERICITEVMGRHCGQIALVAGVACGADIILVPEAHFSVAEVVRRLAEQNRRGKKYTMIILAEGVIPADTLKNKLLEYGISTTRVVLGHIQRGGSPTVFDRMLGSRMGLQAVELLYADKSGRMIGYSQGHLTQCPLGRILQQKRVFPKKLYQQAQIIGF